MDVGESEPIILFEDPRDFSDWLEENHKTAKSLWVRFYKKASGKVSMNYDQALDEALCYGWIDGIVKKYDSESYIQRFTPRRSKSNWSAWNIKHVARLTKEDRMKPAGLAHVEAAKADGRWKV